MQEVKYNAVYGRLYILLGILFSVIFVVGGIILNDLTIYFNLLASAAIIYIGNNVLKNPYAKFDAQNIILYSFWGSERHHYTFKKSDLKLKNGRIYLNKEKLKMNSWFLAKNDWNRILQFYALKEVTFDQDSLD
ncbi:MAG: hypothetical protein R2780_14580 [Crocinitomicaceae bacterium]